MKIIVILALLFSAGCINVETEKNEDLDARLGDIERRLERIEKDIGLREHR